MENFDKLHIYKDLNQALRLTVKYFDANLVDKDVNTSQLSLLYHLSFDNDKTISAIGKDLGLDRTTLCRAFSVLQKKKLIEKIDNIYADKRSKTFKLTAKANAIIAKNERMMEHSYKKLEKALGKKYIEVLGSIQTFVSAIEKVLQKSKKK